MKKKVIAGIIAVAVIIGVFAISRSGKNSYFNVQAIEVSQGELQSYLSTTGIIKSQDMKEYYGPQSQVNKVNVKVGDKVKKGDILVTYEVDNQNNNIKQAEIQYDNAVLQKQDLENQNADINKKIKDKNNQIVDLNNKIEDIENQIKTLQKSKEPTAATQIQELEKTKSSLEQQKSSTEQQRDAIQPISIEKLKQADNSITSSKANLDSAKDKASKVVSKIVSSNDGVVTDVNIVEGGMGNAAQPAVIVQNTENLKVVLSVGKYDADNIKLNQSAAIKNSHKQYKGKVTYIAPVAEKSQEPGSIDTTLTVAVTITDKNPDLKIDFDADTDILLDEVKKAIKVPSECIKTDKEGKNFVYIIKDGKAVEKEIKLGVESDTEAQIIEGLNAGEKVIINPEDTIKNGTLVQISSGETDKNSKKGFFGMRGGTN